MEPNIKKLRATRKTPKGYFTKTTKYIDQFLEQPATGDYVCRRDILLEILTTRFDSINDLCLKIQNNLPEEDIGELNDEINYVAELSSEYITKMGSIESSIV